MAVLASLVTLAALEVVVRLWLDEGAALLLKDGVVGHRFRPSFEEDVYSNSAGRVIHRRFNRDGFRGPEWSVEKPPGVRRVAVLGDSFTASTALDDGETLAAVLEKRLSQEHTPWRWEVFNFGVDAFSPAQSLLVWREFAQRYRFDVVLLCFFNGNDVSDNDRRLTGYPRPYFDLGADGQLVLVPLPNLAVTFTHWLGENSRLYVWQRRRVQDLINRWREQGTRVPGVARYLDPRPEAAVEASWVLTEHILAQLADEVRAAGAQFILVDIPDLVQVRDGDWDTARRLTEPAMAARLQRDYPETRLAAFARAHDIVFVPLLPALSEAVRGADVYLPDGHWNEVGVRAGGETVLRALVPADAGEAVRP